MIFKVSHLFNIIFILPLIYILAIGFRHVFIDLKKNKPKVDFDDLVKRKEQLLLLTVGKTPLDEICKTLGAYKEFESPDQEKILEIFKGLQWGEGPFQRELVALLENDFGINVDFISISNSIKFLIKSELLLRFEKLPNYQKILELTKAATFYKILLSKNEEQLTRYAKFKVVNPDNLKKALTFQIFQDENVNYSQEEFDKGLSRLVLSGKDIYEELFLYIKVLDRLKKVPALESKTDVLGAFKIMGLTESSSKEEIKKRYRDLALAKHPDTFSNINIPPDLIKQASENFSRINSAFKLLMANLS